jgi:hypothetical protein
VDIQEIIATLTEGLEPAEAAVVRKAIERDAVKSKANGWKAQAEFETVAAKAAKVEQLEADLDGMDKDNNPVGFRVWYKKYADAIKANDVAIRSYEAKFGAGSLKKAIEAQSAGDPNPTSGAKAMTEEDFQRAIDKRFQEQFAPKIAGTLKNMGKVMQQHLLSGRKTAVDMEALDKLMGEKGLTLDAAYAEWDKPERDKESEAAIEKRINDAVKERLAKAGSTSFFSGGGEPEPPGVLSRNPGTDKTFDRAAMRADLLRAATTGEYAPGESN